MVAHRALCHQQRRTGYNARTVTRCRRDPALIHVLALVLLGAALYLPHLGTAGLLDPSEPFYPLTARQMRESGDLLTPRLFGQPQWEKPPLTYWLILASTRLMGESEAAARLPSALSAILLLLVTYAVGRRLFERPAVALLGSAMLAVCGKSVALGRLAFTDMTLALCVWTSVWGATLVFWGPRRPALGWLVYWAAAGAGWLTKGPVALLIPSMAVWWYAIASNRQREIRPLQYLSGYALLAVIVVPWYTLMTAWYGTDFLYQSLVHENVRRFFIAEHSGSDRWHFYPLAVLIGLWPWSVLVPAALLRALRLARRRSAGLPEAAVLLGGLVVTSVTVLTLSKSKLASYIYPVYPALTLLAALWLVETHRAVRHSARRRAGLAIAWVCVPLAATAGMAVYLTRTGLTEALAPALVCGSLLTAMGALLCRALGAKRPAAPAAAAALAAVLCVWTVYGSFLPRVEKRFSARPWAAEARQAGLGGAVSSKMCVRGVVYYTGVSHPVVVAGDGPRAWYTPHPLAVVSDTPGLLAQSGQSWPQAGYLRPKDKRMLEVSSNGRLKITEISADTERLLVRLDPSG
ncbi:MAG: Undecaprenyl phosphate-alpha-4-amino-4-deoxy-L-arabinose arabinosyl transferase [Candidatus Omnitrophica bacterium]|nr:Undecaprenyl phosphate-alpha-4-amino-4-deoxy-L-arabinose arabinosyl transferase [Candidatus Omnitrophota bacterium]